MRLPAPSPTVDHRIKPYDTIRNWLVHPKDPTPKAKKCGVVYSVKCRDCPQTYVGETARTFETRLKEHTKSRGAHTAIGEHISATSHTTSMEDTKILAREQLFWRRKIHESIKIKELRPTLNRDTGYHLPAIYNTLMMIAPPPYDPQWEAEREASL